MAGGGWRKPSNPTLVDCHMKPNNSQSGSEPIAHTWQQGDPPSSVSIRAVESKENQNQKKKLKRNPACLLLTCIFRYFKAEILPIVVHVSYVYHMQQGRRRGWCGWRGGWKRLNLSLLSWVCVVPNIFLIGLVFWKSVSSGCQSFWRPSLWLRLYGKKGGRNSRD